MCKLPSELITLINNAAANTGGITMWTVIAVIVGALIIVVAITFVDMGERRVPVQYAKRVVGRKQYGGQSTYIPMKVNQSGVMPLIFAITFVQFLTMIAQFWPESDFYIWWSTYMGTGSAIYAVVLCTAHSVLHVLLQSDRIQPDRRIQEYAAVRRIYPGHSPRKAHLRLSCQDFV